MQERAPDDVLGIFWYRIVHPKWYAFQRSTGAAQLARELESMAAAARQPEPTKRIDVPRPFDDFVFLPPPGRIVEKHQDGTDAAGVLADMTPDDFLGEGLRRASDGRRWTCTNRKLDPFDSCVKKIRSDPNSRVQSENGDLGHLKN